MSLSEVVDAVAAENRFSGVVSVDRGGEVELVRGYGLAHRALGVPNVPETQFGVASGGKTFTALAVMSLVEDGALELSTTARSVLGDDLPLIDDSVTVEHLLAHRSGIGDYIDEEGDWDEADYVLPVPVHTLAETEAFVPVVDGFPQKFGPGERFGYCNGGFIVLALIAERVSGIGYHDLVMTRVCERAGLEDTAFLRSDELPGTAALGYLGHDSDRTNVLHLPVRGNGDGGVYTTAADVSRFWQAVYAGRVVAPRTVEAMVAPRSDVPEEGMRYGLGFWLHPETSAAILAGGDAGVSFYSTHDPESGLTVTALANASEGAFPMARRMRELLG